MPLLVCSAKNCAYNEDMYCSKGEILVGGDEAQSSGETCCTSFRERGEGATNSVGTPSQEIEIECEACNCKYNDQCVCHADKVGIAGSSACDCEDTCCGTFREEK